MADQNKNLTLRLKLEVDDSGSAKLSKGFASIEQKIDVIAQKTSEISKLEKERLSILDKQKNAFANLEATQQRQIAFTEKNNNNAGLALANLDRAIEKYNVINVIAQTEISTITKKINLTSAEVAKLEEKKRLLLDMDKLASAQGAPKTPSMIRGDITSGMTKFGQAESTKIEADRQLALSKEYYANLSVLESSQARKQADWAAQELHRKQANYNAQLVMYSHLYDQIDAREARSAASSRMLAGMTASASVSNRMIAGMTNSARAAPTPATPAISAIPPEVIDSHRNLFLRVGEAIGAYRIWNLAINTVTNSLQAIPKVGIELESTIASLTATTGSAAGMASVMSALEIEANRTGISITTLRETFRGFQASTSLAGETIQSTWHMFTDLNTVITGLHLPAAKASGIFLAMAQIFNKTKVQSEELVKQLGNLLPGAFASFAAANMGVGKQFTSMTDLIAQMRKGLVFAHETVQNFTTYLANRFEPAFALASQGLNSHIGRMNTSFTLLGESMYRMTSGVIVDFVKGFTSIANYLTGAIEGTNNFGTIITQVVNVALAASIALLLKYINAGIISTATTIRETEATIALTVARRASMAALTGVTTATTALTVSQSASIVGSNLLRSSMAFLTSPTAIIAGIALIVMEFKSLYDSSIAAAEGAEEFLRLTKENLAKVTEKPITLELRIDADPEVVKAKAAIAKLEEFISKLQKRAKMINDMGFFSPNKSIIEQQFKTLDGLKDALVILQEKASIELTVNPGGALKDIEEVADHFKLLALQAQGFTEEAAKMQFKIQNAAKTAEAQAIIDASTLEKQLKWKKDIAAFDELNALKVAGTTVDTKVFANAEKEYNNATSNLKNFQLAQQAFEDRSLAEHASGIQKKAKQEADYQQTKLKVESDASAHSTNIEEVRLSATKKAQEQSIKTLQGFAEQERLINLHKVKSDADIVRLKEISILRVQLHEGEQRDIQAAVDAANKRQSESNSGLYTVLNKEAANYSRGIATNLKQLDMEYKNHTVNVETYFQRKSELMQKDVEKEMELNDKALSLATSNKDIEKMEQYQDKQTTLIIKANEINETLNLERVSKQIDNSKLYFDIEIEYLNSIGESEQANHLQWMESHRQQIAIINTEAASNNEAAIKAKIQQDSSIKYSDAKFKIAQLNIKADTAKNALADEELRINQDLQGGYLTQIQAMEKLVAARNEYIKVAEGALSVEEKLSVNAQQQLDIARRTKELNALKTEGAGASQAFLSKGTPSYLQEYQTSQASLDKGVVADKAKADITLAESAPPTGSLDTAGYDPVAQHQAMLDAKSEADTKYHDASQANTLNLYSGMAGTAASTFEGITSLMIKMYGAQSKQAKMAFLAYKAAKIAEITMSTASLVISMANSGAQWGPAGVFMAPAAAALAAAMGAIQIATVIAQPMPAAHGGLTNVPKEQTYLLDKGERVLSPNQNKDLTNYMNQGKMGNGGSSSPNIRIINSVDPDVFNEYLGSDAGERVVMNIVKRNKTGVLS